MYKIEVANADTKKVVASYSFSTLDAAKLGRLDIMTEWVRMCNRRVVVSSVIRK